MSHLIKLSIAVVKGLICLIAFSCNNKQPEFTSKKQLAQHQSDGIYACPMHPEITGKKGDSCSTCGMDLLPLEKESSENIEVKFSHTPEKLETGVPSELSLHILKDGKNASLDVVHEKKIHMLVVDEGLTWFDHIHPVEQADGSYTVTESFPYNGNYFVYADFKPQGSAGAVHKHVLEVNGPENPPIDTIENKWKSQVDGYSVTLINGHDFQTNRPQHLGIRIEKDGHNITSDEIEPYLGAIAHVVIIGKKDKEMLHVHPGSNHQVPIHGETRFETPGIYRIWVQFQLEGKVLTADFTIKVKEGPETVANQHHDHNNHHQH
ncbi:MAG: heavy metal-binding domain-containing protein [Saprospiraceae bacterium]